MKTILANVAVKRVGVVRRQTLNGRSYLVAPMTMIVPGVLNGSKGALYYPPEEVSREVGAWNHMPLVINHPVDDAGNNTTARSPETLERYGVGYVFHARYVKNSKGKPGLRAQAWFDEELLRNKAPEVYQAVSNGKAVELSTGLFTDNYKARQGATVNGRSYAYVARNYRPDHLAILPDQKGACANEHGCGVNVVNCEYEDGVCVNCGGEGGTMGPCPGTGVSGSSGGRPGEKVKVTKVKPGNKVVYRGEAKIVKRFEEKQGGVKIHFADGTSTGVMLKSASLIFNALPNQPRSKNTGKLKRMNAGTGKGPLHQTAQDGFHGGPKKCEQCDGETCTCETTTNSGDEVMKLTDKQRKDVVSFLTTNCDCWKGKEKVLNAFDDEHLTALKTAREEAMEDEAVANAARETLTELGAEDEHLTANAMPQFIKDKMKRKGPEDEEDDEEEEPMVMRRGKGKAKPTGNTTTQDTPVKKTAEEWMAEAPPEIQEWVGNARDITTNEKKRLVGRLVANVKDAKLKDRLVANHMKKPLAQLRDEVAALPVVNTPKAPADFDRIPDYSGAGGGYVGNEGAGDDESALVTEEDLTPPTLNYSELAGNVTRKAKAKTA